LSGWFSSSISASHSFDVTRRVNMFGSNSGAETSARISPVFGSIAIALPTRSLKDSSASCWSGRSIVR